MQIPPSPIYKVITDSISVKDIADPIFFRVPPDEPINIICDKFTFYGDVYCLVESSEKIYGIITMFDDALLENTSGSAKDVSWPITVDRVITDSFPVLDLPRLLEMGDSFFVLTGNKITHTVSFEQFDCLPMKTCLFTLFMELESDLLRILKKRDHQELSTAFCRLSAGRLLSINDLYNEKHPEKNNSHSFTMINAGKKDISDGLEDCEDNIILEESDYRELLGCTNFSDKKRLISHFPDIYNKLPFDSKTEYDSFFYKVQNLRNRIAHSEPIIYSPYNPKEFADFIEKLKSIIEITSKIEVDEDFDYEDW